jgi:hypothetical protein
MVVVEVPAQHQQPTSDLDPQCVRVVHDHADRIYSRRYERERPQLVTLYDKAAGSQWNSAVDSDWSTDVDPVRVATDEALVVLLARRASTSRPLI